MPNHTQFNLVTNFDSQGVQSYYLLSDLEINQFMEGNDTPPERYFYRFNDLLNYINANNIRINKEYSYTGESDTLY